MCYNSATIQDRPTVKLFSYQRVQDSVKNCRFLYLAQGYMLTDFQISPSNSAANLQQVLLQFSPHLKHVATLPCETFVFKN